MNKKAVEAMARAIAEADGHDWDNPCLDSESDDEAMREYYRCMIRPAIAAARPHILEEAALIADEMMNDAFSKSLNSKEPNRTAFRFRVETSRRLAAAIRAAMEATDE